MGFEKKAKELLKKGKKLIKKGVKSKTGKELIRKEKLVAAEMLENTAKRIKEKAKKKK
jgi:chaperonin GroEL (HSP60 family)